MPCIEACNQPLRKSVEAFKDAVSRLRFCCAKQHGIQHPIKSATRPDAASIGMKIGGGQIWVFGNVAGKAHRIGQRIAGHGLAQSSPEARFGKACSR